MVIAITMPTANARVPVRDALVATVTMPPAYKPSVCLGKGQCGEPGATNGQGRVRSTTRAASSNNGSVK
jgi:hypothetical protein